MLFESPEEIMRLSWSVIIPTVLMTALFFIFAVGLAIKAQNRRPTTGTEGLLGEIGIARTSLKKDGQILLHGEIWTATSDQAVKVGDRVKVISVDHLEVKVEKV